MQCLKSRLKGSKKRELKDPLGCEGSPKWKKKEEAVRSSLKGKGSRVGRAAGYHSTQQGRGTGEKEGPGRFVSTRTNERKREG